MNPFGGEYDWGLDGAWIEAANVNINVEKPPAEWGGNGGEYTTHGTIDDIPFLLHRIRDQLKAAMPVR